MKHNNGNGVFVFISSSHHLEYDPFPHVVVMLTTLKTSKKIFRGNNNIMQSGNSKQDHPGQENYKPYKVIYPKLFTMALFTA